MPSSQRQPIPADWATYESGGRHGSSDSNMSANRITWDEGSQDHHLRPSSIQEHNEQELRQRRSSMAIRVHALRQAGGVNSLDNFAASWQRAAGFLAIAPVRQSFKYTDEDGEHDEEDSGSHNRASIREALAARNGDSSHAVFDDEDEEGEGETPRPITRTFSPQHGSSTITSERTSLLRPPPRHQHGHEDSIISIEPQLGSPFGGSYGGTWCIAWSSSPSC